MGPVFELVLFEAMQINSMVAVLSLCGLLLLTGCGGKRDAEGMPLALAATASNALAQHERAPFRRSDYATTFDLGRDNVDGLWWDRLRAAMVRALAADRDLDDEALAAAAFVDLSREHDVLQRQARIKAHRADLAALRAQASAKLHVTWGIDDEGGLRATVLPYDTRTESYRIRIFGLDDPHGYSFQRVPSRRNSPPIEQLMLALQSPGYDEFVQTVPKEEVESLEARLAQLRIDDPDRLARLRVSVFATVTQTERLPTWLSAVVNARVDAVGLHMPGTSPKELVLLLESPIPR